MTRAETFSLMLQATTSTSKKKHHSLQASIVKSFSRLLLLAMSLSLLHHSPWPPLTAAASSPGFHHLFQAYFAADLRRLGRVGVDEQREDAAVLLPTSSSGP